jgi:hypothetical protein
MKRHTQRKPVRGFMAVDVVMALGLLGITVAILVSASTRTDRAVDRLSDDRNASRIAEEALIDLEAGLPIPGDDQQTKISVEACQGGAKVSGRRWVRVVVTYHGGRGMLVGLAPENTAVRQSGGDK